MFLKLHGEGRMIEPSDLMAMAIAKCQEGIDQGQSPFGCAIAVGGRVIAVAHNTVLQSIDITAHAEVNAIRQGCHALGEIFLEGAVVATTCEPCPMCMAALHWARVETVYFGASIADAESAGFNELQLPAAELLRIGGSQLKLVPGLLDDDCRALFRRWQQSPAARTY